VPLTEVPLRRWHAELAWLGDSVAADVLIEAVGPRISEVRPESACPDDAVRLPGLTLPGLANAHSHAFHRALRGRTQAGAGTFWTWREAMYRLAERLTPERYLALAEAVYAEMALAGVTCVGEFHYLHHGPGGRPYAERNEMGLALVEAAARAGIRITLIDACYLTGGVGIPLAGPQLRFGDGSAEGWAQRAEELADRLKPTAHARVGAAVHSVRAVPPEAMAVVARWATDTGAPLHTHLSEQRAENTAYEQAYRRTPTEALAEAGALGPGCTAVHATHLTGADVNLLGRSRTAVCMCPTTERDLADGIGPARALSRAGAPLVLGSDSHAVIDLFEEARAVELDERLRTERRGHWRAAELLEAATAAGHASLGWPDAGRLAPGGLADLVTVATDRPRTAGARPATVVESVVFAATAAEVSHVVVAGEPVVADGVHLRVGDVAAAYRAVFEELDG
jgi:formiminoglutamate deiminase